MNQYIHGYEKNANGGRDLVVGDIHGHYENLMVALAKLTVNGLLHPFNPLKDRLFSVGDLVDRGPDSPLVVSLLKEPWFFAIKGNHEDMAIRWFDRQPGSDECEMPTEGWNMDAGGYAWNGGAWFLALSEAEQLLIVNSLRPLPLAIELETDEGLLGIIHAEVIADDWWLLRSACENYIPSKFAKLFKMATEQAMWSRERIQQERETKPVRGVEAVACGHTPLKRVVISDNQVYIDTMGWRPDKGGRFTIMEASSIIKLARDAAKAE